MSLVRRSNDGAEGIFAHVERLLEAERAQLPLWAPIALGAGVCAWFALPAPIQWIAWVMGWLGLAIGVGALARGGRFSHAIMIGATLMAAGCLLPWGKAMLVGAPPLARAAAVEMRATLVRLEPQAERGTTRLLLAPIARPDLPARLRVNAGPEALPKGLARGDVVTLRAWLMPPPTASLPGGYDFAMRAYFDGIGATGRVLGTVKVAQAGDRVPGLRDRLTAHIRARLGGPEGEIAATLATGDRSGIDAADAEAMRDSGLAHLLSISGLHVSAMIGGVMLIVYRLLALSPTLALRLPLILIAACAGAGAGVGYTLLTGAEVPTVRSCVAALLVIAGLALGREAISLRLIATGALIVMAFWPEAVIGPSFQMSFAAVTAIVALYEWAPARDFFARTEEALWRRAARGLGVLLVTGIAVELILMPIAIFHFHRAGLLGALANLVAIPLTSFVIMPAEALALLLDLAGLGAPAWAVTGWALGLMLWIAHQVAAMPFAVMAVPTIGSGLFAMTMLGALWLMLWRTRLRLAGLPLLIAGAVAMALAPAADILVTADGRHVAVRTGAGYALLRERAGDYMRDTLAESAGYGGAFAALTALPAARCSSDLCIVDLERRDGQTVRLLATRTGLHLPWPQLVQACAAADIVVADRTMPRGCTPRWLKLDRRALAGMGGALILLDGRRVIAGRDARDRHPWRAVAGRSTRVVASPR